MEEEKKQTVNKEAQSQETESSATEQEQVPDEPLAVVEEPPEKKVEKLEKDLEELKDKYLRLYAEFENYKKRVQKDRIELINYATETLITELLTVVDNLEMALKHVDEGNNTMDALKEGVELTLRELKKVLSKQGVKEIEALGKPFNPEFHHAMAQVERDDLEDKTVVEEYRKGYIMKDKVIRPSLVAVSRKVEKKEEVSSSEGTEAEGENSE